jgi:hypothetical protein
MRCTGSGPLFDDGWNRPSAEAVEAFKAQELAAMTEERAWQIIQRLGAPEGWRERRDWSGLVEQQAIFHKRRFS